VAVVEIQEHLHQTLVNNQVAQVEVVVDTLLELEHQIKVFQVVMVQEHHPQEQMLLVAEAVQEQQVEIM
jgi:hypothetical protein